MFSNLTFKGLYDKRWFILGWSVGLVGMITLTLAFYPFVKEQLSILLKDTPDSLQSFIGDSAAYSTLAGYIGSGVFELRVPLLLLPMAIILGVSLSVSEEVTGQLYQLLVLPLSRTRIVLEKWLTMLATIGVIHLLMLASLIIMTIILAESVALTTLLTIVIMSYLLAVSVGSITLFLAFATGRRALVIMISSVVAFGSYLITSFATQVSWLEPFDVFSLFHYYHTPEVVKNGLNTHHVMILLAVTLVSIGLSIVTFVRRDIGTKG